MIAVLGVHLLQQNEAQGNIRGPRIVPWMPSTAASAVNNLTVRHEDLSFSCDSSQCKVVATYFVRSRQPYDVELRFIIPVPALATARVGNAAGRVSVIQAPAKETTLEKNIFFDYREYDRPPCYQATVTAPISVGENTLTFEYLQPLGAFERGYGYFFPREGRMVQEFAYGLWPLREWRRAPDFKIHLTVTIPRMPPTRWQRWFGKTKTIACFLRTEPPQADPHLEPSREQRGNVFWYEADIAGEIPTEVACHIGDDDLVTP
jgi:hypothetical protein